MTERTSPVSIYIPALGTYLDRELLPKSGLVGVPAADDRVLVYYEGNKYGAENMRTWADKLYHAADRLLWKGIGYPTIAFAFVPRDDVLMVGQLWHPERRIEIHDSEKVSAWLGKDALEYPDSAEPELQFSDR